MAHGPKKWTEATIERMRLEGRGQGEGKLYKPWIEVLEVSSKGRSRRVPGIKTGRDHQLLSDVEWKLFLLLEWARNVVDIREQYPLDRELTLEIASMLRIRHPVYPGTKVPVVMTVDFLTTEERDGRRSLAAYNAKTTLEAENVRSMEKLEIQRYYLQGMGIPHHLVFSSEIPAQTVGNLERIRGGAVKQGELEPYPNFFTENAQRMVADLARRKPNETLAQYCVAFDRRFGLSVGTGMRVALILMLDRILLVDLESPDLPNAPLASFPLAQNAGHIKRVGAGG
jgi:hypothetical protein